MQPELAMGCCTDYCGLLAKEGSGCWDSWLDRGTGPWATWASLLPRAGTYHPELGGRLPDPACVPSPGLALAFHDGSVHIVHRLSLQTMAVFYSSVATRAVDEPAIKRPRTTGSAIHFKAMQLSWTSLALVGIDNHGKASTGLGVSKSPVWWGLEQSLPHATRCLGGHGLCQAPACHF